MVNTYLKLKQTRQKEVDKFPMFFAFNKEQFAEGLKKLNVKQEELISIFGGGFIRKSDKAKYIMMMDKQDNEHIRMMQDKNYVYNMFRYELANHEYCVREEDEDTLQSLNLTIEDVNKNNLLKEQLMKAKKDYMAQY